MSLRRLMFVDRIKSSLFFTPSLFVAGSIALALAMIAIDDRIAPSAEDLPFFLGSTVDSARAVLQTVATATITVAGIAFSISLLVIQLASSQYSPRVVHGLFRDPFNKQVMGLVVGTFTYCLVVLQSVRTAVTDDGSDVVPNLSVGVALFLGVGSILAIVAFINHNAHAMEVSEILQEVTDLTLDAVTDRWSSPDDAAPPLPEPRPDSQGFAVAFDSNGWVQHVDEGRLLDLVEPGGIIRLDIGVGRYAINGVALATIWPRPVDPEATSAGARAAVKLGRTRTLSQDPAYGIRQLADVGIHALSSGIDDPTTAQDAIFHLAAVLREMHQRVPPPRVVVDDDDRCLVLSEAPDHADIVSLAFGELTRSAAAHPEVCIYLLEALSLLCGSDNPAPPDDARRAMIRQAERIRDAAVHANLAPHDQDLVVEAFDNRFGSGS